jgi:cysteinyl-tRNA synthetase
MSMKYLGSNFDIHVSSQELVFPHHENENAIAEALTGKSLAKYWIHCGRVLVDGKTVDEKGVGLSLQDLIEMNYSGREIRSWLLSNHYRKPVTFSKKRLEETRRSLKRLDACIHSLMNISEGRPYAELKQLLYDIKIGFVRAMDDDLNISAAIASMFNMVKQVNILVKENRIDTEGAVQVLDAFRNLDTVLAIFDFGEVRFEPDTQTLVSERDTARKEKNWILADKIRDQLRSHGIIIQDQKI